MKSNVINVSPNMLVSVLNIDLPNTTNKRLIIFKLDINKTQHNYMLLTRNIRGVIKEYSV